ncbi:hypothetical protein [Acinetobacter baumannii]|uniref:hypothetical protein n=1 Tax=Acinetobacter baumannii TaxID=470 RepID=UPI003F4BFBBB
MRLIPFFRHLALLPDPERYEQGIPLSLDQQAINVYAEHNDLPVAAHIFNDCIFALDNLFLDEAHKKINSKSSKK